MLQWSWRTSGDSWPLVPTAHATEAEQVAAAERVVVTQRSAAGAALVATAVERAAIRPVDVAGIGAVGDAQLRKRVIALRIGNTGLAGRKAVAGLVQPGIART